MSTPRNAKRLSRDRTNMPRPASLSLKMPQSTSAVSSTLTSPSDPGSGMSSPASSAANPAIPGNSVRHHKPSKSVPLSISGPQSPQLQPSSPEITSLPAFPPSPKEGSKNYKDSSKSFFSNLKASKSSTKVQNFEPSIRHVSEDSSRQKENVQPKSLYSLRKSPGSTPDLSLSNFEVSSIEDQQGRLSERQETRPPATSVGSDSAIAPSPTQPIFIRKPKPRFPNFIKRTQSTKVDIDGKRSKPTTPISANAPSRKIQYDGTSEVDDPKPGPPTPRTAPIRPDRSLREIIGSNARGRSADRPPSNHSSETNTARHLGPPSSASNSTSALSSSTAGFHREGAGSHLFANIKNTSSRAAGGIKGASKGLLRKMERRPSSTGREDEHYVLKTIHLPLIQQTRNTRIAARLEDSKDKTEFWMPALPWRCIDYLNFRGCEEEGIYRVPGSEVQIRHWQRRFDREGDIDLFNEHELYDINIIGSMFKSWLRDLPEEILPKATQAKVAREHPDATTVPQMFRDELSMLPPWNYYLLFAITCHLSLLTAYADKNKMTYNNLCVCFQPCLKIETYCFRFLVEQWRDCWQGCFTEKEALEEEYRLLDGLVSSGADSSNSSTEQPPPADEQLFGTSANSKRDMPIRGKPPALNLKRAGNEAPPATPAIMLQEDQQNGHAAATSMASKVPELAPMKPLSPMNAEFKNNSPEKAAHHQPRAQQP